jgi:hypothetical protein
MGTKVIQSATTIGSGLLPIGLQGIAQNKTVKQHLPQSVQDVINANTPGSNALLKSVGSSFGLTPVTDKTVGKGLSTTRYYNAVDSSKQGLNAQEKRAVDEYTGSKKNPVTGAYDVKPTVWDTITKAAMLNQNPKAVKNLYNAFQKEQSLGEKIDPLWNQSLDNIKKYFQYQAMDIKGNQKDAWYANNKSWYQPLANDRSTFFSSLPPSDPNKPTAPIEFPQASPTVQSQKDTYYAMTDSTQKFQFIKAHPELQDQFDSEFKYYNDMLVAQGKSPYKDYPKATPEVQKFTDDYTAADKVTRESMRNSNPQMYQNMVAFFDSADLYGIGKSASVNQLQGQPNYTSDEAKKISSLANDIYKNADGTYSIVPAGWMNGLSNGSGGYGSSPARPSLATASKIKVPKVPKITAKKPATMKATATKKLSVSKIPTNYLSKKLR